MRSSEQAPASRGPLVPRRRSQARAALRLLQREPRRLAILPASELSSWTSQGYSAQSGANPWIGYVYENVDTDGDHVIDGFENLIGTNPSAADSDCDGASDGAEILESPYTDPEVGSC